MLLACRGNLEPSPVHSHTQMNPTHEPKQYVNHVMKMEWSKTLQDVQCTYDYFFSWFPTKKPLICRRALEELLIHTLTWGLTFEVKGMGHLKQSYFLAVVKVWIFFFLLFFAVLLRFKLYSESSSPNILIIYVYLYRNLKRIRDP